MASDTTQQRRAHFAQALANTRIEGHVPTPEFLADVARCAAGGMTQAQLRAASLERALAADRAAALAAADMSEMRHAARVR